MVLFNSRNLNIMSEGIPVINADFNLQVCATVHALAHYPATSKQQQPHPKAAIQKPADSGQILGDNSPPNQPLDLEIDSPRTTYQSISQSLHLPHHNLKTNNLVSSHESKLPSPHECSKLHKNESMNPSIQEWIPQATPLLSFESLVITCMTPLCSSCKVHMH